MVNTALPARPADRRLAAIDLGSNSFRLIIAEAHDSSVGHQLRIVDEIKETVRLGAGLDRNQELSPQAQQKALQTLALFAERLHGFDPESIRAVATNTFRIARNSDGFLKAASETLGFPIEVVAGREEARLIYLGAAHELPLDHRKRLVVDIGGGSTECIIGQDYETLRRESLQMGSVSITRDFFPDGKVTKGALRKARIHCGEQIAEHVRAFKRLGWEYTMGTSGTAKSLCQVATLELGSDLLNLEVLSKLEQKILAAGNVDGVVLAGLKPDRRPVFAGGLAVMQAIFDELGIDSLRYCESAMREGVLFDMLGRRSGSDRREITIRHMIERYRLDERHGREVAKVARRILDQLTEAKVSAEDAQMVDWAARIREVGAFIAHADAHKHGGYIMANADLPGFSPVEQRQIAWLVLGQSGGLRKMTAGAMGMAEWAMLFALRIAVILQRRRDGRSTPIRIVPERGGLERGWTIELPQNWVDQHPLTNRSLECEAEEWRAIGVFRNAEYRVVSES